MFLELVSQCIENNQKSGAIVLLSEYRPDIAQMIAHHLKLKFYDYREKELLPLGWGAAEVTLDQLDEALFNASSQGPILAFNIEALLALKTENERREWLVRFLQHSWPNQIVIPITIHLNDIPNRNQQVCDLLSTVLPEQNLINRLAL